MPAHHRRWRRGRRHFLARFAIVFILVLSLSAYGAATLIRELAGSAGGFAATGGLVWAAIFLLAIGFGATMRLVGRPLSDVVGAAERVASGDFAVRVAEHGPPSLRSVAHAFNSMTTKLETQQQARRALMADVAHELRTPLAVMQGRLEGMLDGVYPRDEQQVTRVLDDARTLARLVDDLRTLAHSESGTLTLETEPTDLGTLIEETVASFQPEAHARNVNLAAAVQSGLPPVDLDPVRIREVLLNLLSNAVRHSPDGGRVEIGAEAGDANVTIQVSDEGSGIRGEDLPHIFDRFYKAPDSTGSGLGLTIARSLIAAHGGAIGARSRPQGGTIIEFTLPTSYSPPSNVTAR